MKRAVFLLPLLLGACATAPAKPAAPAAPAGGAAGGAAANTGPTSYEKAIPKAAKPDSGVILVHRSDDKLLFEIPDSIFGRDMLLVSRIAAVPANLSPFTTAGVSTEEQVVRWERRGNKIHLRRIAFEQVADDSLPIATSVVMNNFAPIVAAFDVKAEAPGGGAVIDVTAFFEDDVPAISGLGAEQRTQFGVRRLDKTRSFINYARSFPLNVEIRHTLTYEATKPPSNANAGTISMEMNQSLVLLPREPMRPRYADPRVGYFGVKQVNFGLPDQKAATQSFISRWRLEPSDPTAYARGELVEPVKPIVYYLDPATPAEWRSCVKQGVEDWKGPFESAGFRNAIIAMDAPDDPDWSPEDVRHSVVRWAASLTRNAMGPSTWDPRSGEIIESDIVWYHNHLRSYRNRLVLETGAANPLARSLPVDQGLMCEAVRAVIAHEVGHALGLPHNMAASSAYPVDSLRNVGFVRRMGLTPSIMDYARQNYIAQPGDGLVGVDFIRKIGPYDHYSIEWGYRAIPDAPNPEAERPVLHRWILEKAGDPKYRFSSFSPADPGVQTEDLGHDPVRASGYGVANLKRVASNLVQWTSRPGEDYSDLSELYGELVGMWSRYMGHVVSVVGGVRETPKSTDQTGPVFDPVSRAEQKAALRFLDQQVFTTPTWLVDPAILGRLEHAGAVERIADLQSRFLSSLLAPDRLQRLVEVQASGAGDTYPLAEYLDDVHGIVWRELDAGRSIELSRRTLQRSYLERMEFLLNSETPRASAFSRGTPYRLERSEVRPLVRAQLRDLRGDAVRAAARAADRVTRAHLQDVVARVDRILEGPES